MRKITSRSDIGHTRRIESSIFTRGEPREITLTVITANLNLALRALGLAEFREFKAVSTGMNLTFAVWTDAMDGLIFLAGRCFLFGEGTGQPA